MISRLARILRSDSSAERPRPVATRYVYQPQPPMGFVRRTDPSYSFLNRR
jgi:hypothetical protein